MTLVSTESTTESTPLRGVFPIVPEYILQWRKETGADRWDEMWEGVLHMGPMPSINHQEFEGWLEFWLRLHWCQRTNGKVWHIVNVTRTAAQWPQDYRIPDLVLLKAERFHLQRPNYFLGGPNVVVEIHSPGDESYEKLPFYFEIGCEEAWIFERDTWRPSILTRGPTAFAPLAVAADGWSRSPVTLAEFQQPQPGLLAARLAGDDATREVFPRSARPPASAAH